MRGRDSSSNSSSSSFFTYVPNAQGPISRKLQLQQPQQPEQQAAISKQQSANSSGINSSTDRDQL